MASDTNLEVVRISHSLKTKLSATIAMVSLLTICLISLLSNFLVERQFTGYVKKQRETATVELAASIGRLYHEDTKSFDLSVLHQLGMNALYEGYILKIYDLQDTKIWDAEECDMTACIRIMNDISTRMAHKYPELNGQFVTEKFPVSMNGSQVGTVDILFYGPYFLNEDDFQFLRSLNILLVFVSIFSLAVSVLIGIITARHMSLPILKTIGAAKKISNGEYSVRVPEMTRTKEILDLISSVNQLADSLEKQESMRKQLTADVAHELRTPLTTLQTHIEAMAEGVWEPTPSRLSSCYDETLRLSRLVKDLEKLARLESANYSLEKSSVSLDDTVKKALVNFDPLIGEKGLKVTLEGSCGEIPADPDRLVQVAVNLLSNAVKYTPEGGDIHIRLYRTEKEAQLQIEDNGIGIPEDSLPYIFERFYRADKSRNRHTGGSGIGLAIVKSIVVAHGGRVEVKSTVNKGSTFTVRLPLE